MRQFTIATIFAAAISAREIRRGFTTPVPDATVGNISSAATLGEVEIIDGKEKAIFFNVQWENSVYGGNFDDDSLI